MARRRIVIVDDHPLFRAALRQTLAAGDPSIVMEEAGDLTGLNAALEADRDCDLVLLDLNMPGMHGFSGLLYLRAEFAAVPVVVISANEKASVMRRALDLGAVGYIPKSAAAGEIRSALRALLAGETWLPAALPPRGPGSDGDAALAALLNRLTPQQSRVLMLLSDGLLNKQIAHAMQVSEATVKAHVSAILQKLGVDNRTQAVIVARRLAGEVGEPEAEPPPSPASGRPAAE